MEEDGRPDQSARPSVDSPPHTGREAVVAVPRHEQREVPWQQTSRGGSFDDRTLRRVVVAIPPAIAEVDPEFPGILLAECDDAVREIAGLDATRGEHLRSLVTLLLRAESVASSRNALYVPPPPAQAAGLMGDLVRFARRTDLPVIGQAAMAHAQFASIHPFTDGNGRVGRALAAAVLRARGVARNVVVPIASALVARREHYFDTLTAYRDGDVGPITRAFARSVAVAAQESSVTADRLAAMPEQWRERAGRPRAGSAPAALLASLPSSPIFTAEDIEHRLRLPTASAYRAIDRLVTTGVVRPLTDRTRNRIWGAADLLDELDDLGVRIAAGARSRL